MAEFYKNSNGGYSINYDDQKFQDLKNEQTQKEAELAGNYDSMINNSDKYYQDQIQAAQDYANKQTELQQAQTNQQITEINQQKEQSQNNYTKEQMGSYADYMKQTKSNAQDMANSGLSNTGYSESSLVSMYNQYQSRVATAKDSLNNVIMNYNNSINQAVLANNQTLAEIAYNALQSQNTLNQQAFEYKNQLILNKEQSLQNLNDTYYARNQDLINNINTEIQLQMELDRIDREYEQWLADYNQKKAQFEEANAQWWANFNASNAQWEKDHALRAQETAASIAQSQAQTNYYNAQANSLKATSNPYTQTTSMKKTYSKDEVLKNIRFLQGARLENNIKDNISGKTFKSVDALLEYYGYANVD